MNIKKSLNALFLSAIALASLHAMAGNVNPTDARLAANTFLKQQVAATPGTLKAPALSDLRLAHAENSSAVAGANDYYVFNIAGGGFIIVAGEDRAMPVLGYCDKGRFDFNNLPAPLKDLLVGYKAEIEFLQTYQGNDLSLEPIKFNDASTVGPLITSTWGQEMPYYLQCPVYQGEYCVVGCIATAMAQVMYYWQYPTSSSSISRYYCYDIGGYVAALPATTFDYSLMIDSYCHWDWDNSELIQDTYTDAQAQEVAKLGRYCGQAVQMGYSPEGSGAYASDQASAMQSFGFNNVKHTYKYYNSSQWDNILKTEIDAGRPILYSAADPSAGGHAFICDGYDGSGYFHFNMGWYGTCDGWYTTSALNMTHRSGEYLRFNSSHEIVYGFEPSAYCRIDVESLDADNDLKILGSDVLNAQALNVTFSTTYSNFNLLFALTDANGSRVLNGGSINIVKNSFVQGSNVDGTLALPARLEPGTYNLSLYYYPTSASQPVAVTSNATGQLVVVGHVAKYNAPFNIADVTEIIDMLLDDSNSVLDISDVTSVIDCILSGN